jgi:hypothetical protein
MVRANPGVSTRSVALVCESAHACLQCMCPAVGVFICAFVCILESSSSVHKKHAAHVHKLETWPLAAQHAW